MSPLHTRSPRSQIQRQEVVVPVLGETVGVVFNGDQGSVLGRWEVLKICRAFFFF